MPNYSMIMSMVDSLWKENKNIPAVYQGVEQDLFRGAWATDPWTDQDWCLSVWLNVCIFEDDIANGDVAWQ